MIGLVYVLKYRPTSSSPGEVGTQPGITTLGAWQVPARYVDFQLTPPGSRAFAGWKYP